MQLVTQVAVIGQQGIGQRDPPRCLRHQGVGAGFLQAGGAEGTAQAAFRLLAGLQAAGHQGVGEVGGEAVVAHQPRHFLNQIHLTLQVHRPRGWHLHPPALVVLGVEGAAERLQGGLDAAVAEIFGLPLHQHRTEQVVEMVPIQPERLLWFLGTLMQPATLHPGPRQLHEQGDSPVGGSEGGLPGQSLLETAAGLGAQAHAAG